MAANDVPCCEPMFWVYLVICVGIVVFAGLMSGLTLGLMSLSLVDLEVLVKAGRPQDRKNAAKILPIVKNQHLLLCTLLISNSLAMEALPIFLDALLPAWGAILISVTLILAFGEIIPQAICSRYGLSVGAKLCIVVRFLVLLLFPLAYPISKLLDWILGKGHSALLRRAELKTFVDMHGNKAGKGGELSQDETTIIAGALDMSLKTSKDAMTPLSRVFSLDVNSKLDDETMSLILSKGHSRVPIYSGCPTNIIGLILVKSLIKYSPENEISVKDLAIRTIPRVPENLPLYDILNQFKGGNSHMAFVVKTGTTKQISWPESTTHARGINTPTGKTLAHDRAVVHEQTKHDEEIIGIITLEDVMEELLQEEILDETDEYTAIHNKLIVNMQASRRSPALSSSSPQLSHQSYHSPISSYNHSPILHSPIPPYIPSPLIRPVLSSSPTKFVHISTTGYASPIGASLAPPMVSRKLYDKLRQTGES